MAGLGEQRRALSRILLDEPVVHRVRGLGAQQSQRHQQQPGQGAPHGHDPTSAARRLGPPHPEQCPDREDDEQAERGAERDRDVLGLAGDEAAAGLEQDVAGLTEATAWIQPASSVSGT